MSDNRVTGGYFFSNYNLFQPLLMTAKRIEIKDITGTRHWLTAIEQFVLQSLDGCLLISSTLAKARQSES